MAVTRAARLGGYPADARLAAATPGAVQKQVGVLNQRSDMVKAGGVPYDAPVACPEVKKSTGEPCAGRPTKSGRCVGHERAYQNQK